MEMPGTQVFRKGCWAELLRPRFPGALDLHLPAGEEGQPINLPQEGKGQMKHWKTSVVLGAFVPECMRPQSQAVLPGGLWARDQM